MKDYLLEEIKDMNQINDDLISENKKLELEIEELKCELIECRKSLKLLQSFKVINLEERKSAAKIKAELKKEIADLKAIINDIPGKYEVEDESFNQRLKRFIGMI